MRKIIGIDLGHCETTAAYPSAYTDAETGKEKYKIRRLAAGPDKDMIISTQIILTKEQMEMLDKQRQNAVTEDWLSFETLQGLGEIQIGNNLKRVSGDKGERFRYFKAPPREFQEPCGDSEIAGATHMTHEIIMGAFIYAFVGQLFQYNEGEISENDRTETDLLIGCPSTADWTDPEAGRKYGELIKRVTNVHDVKIVPESRAAMFSSVENHGEAVSAAKGAIVFDFGSLTADATYMLMGKKLMEFSWNLGASEIELQMVRVAYERAMTEKGSFSASSMSLMNNADELRKAKEDYFRGNFGDEGQAMICSFTDEADHSVKRVAVEIDATTMETVTREYPIEILCDSGTNRTGTWQSLCRDFFETAKERIGKEAYSVRREDGSKEWKNCPVQTIVLTGGASRMTFIRDICREVFTEAEIYTEETPSYTVSNGLCWVAVTDENLEGCIDETIKAVNESDCRAEKLKDNLVNAIYKKICDITVEQAGYWAELDGDQITARALQDGLKTYMASREAQNALRKVCADEIGDWRKNLSQIIDKAVNEQLHRLYSEGKTQGLMLLDDAWKEIQMDYSMIGKIDIGNLIENIDLTSYVGELIKGLSSIIIYVIAWVTAGPTAGLSLLGALVADKVIDGISDKNLDKPRNKKLRQSVAEKMEGHLRDPKVIKSFMKPMRQNMDAMTDNIQKQIEDTVTATYEIVALKRFDSGEKE